MERERVRKVVACTNGWLRVYQDSALGAGGGREGRRMAASGSSLVVRTRAPTMCPASHHSLSSLHSSLLSYKQYAIVPL